MKYSEIKSKIIEKFGADFIIEEKSTTIQPCIRIESTKLHELCDYLYRDSELYFDFLACITAIDNFPDSETIEVLYHLNSIPFEHQLVIQVILARNLPDNQLPEIDSVSDIWKTADWHEREAFDLVGINFKNHPDLRRILLPADWVGHPLRKDYQEQDTYHGIKIKY